MLTGFKSIKGDFFFFPFSFSFLHSLLPCMLLDYTIVLHLFLAPCVHTSTFLAPFRNDHSVPSARARIHLFSGHCFPADTLACNLCPTLVSVHKCHSLLATLSVAIWCHPPSDARGATRSGRELVPAASAPGACQSFLQTSQVSNLPKITR